MGGADSEDAGEGSSSKRMSFTARGKRRIGMRGGQSSSGEESEDRSAVIRDVVAGVVTRVVASAVEAEKKAKMEAEKEAKMEAEKKAKMEAEKKAKMEAEKVKIETPPDAETAAAIRECVERAVTGSHRAGEALQAISTPPPAKRKVDPFATATTSTRGSGASSTRTPKQTVAGAKLTERLSEARCRCLAPGPRRSRQESASSALQGTHVRRHQGASRTQTQERHYQILQARSTQNPSSRRTHRRERIRPPSAACFRRHPRARRARQPGSSETSKKLMRSRSLARSRFNSYKCARSHESSVRPKARRLRRAPPPPPLSNSVSP